MAQPVDPVHVLRGHFGEVQAVTFLSEDYLLSGDNNGEVKLWELQGCRAEQTIRLHDANAGVMHLACLPGQGLVASQGRDGCVRLWALEEGGMLRSAAPLAEVRTESFNFCRCAVWAPGAAGAGAAAPSAGPAGGVRDVWVACAAHEASDVGVWRPGQGHRPCVTLTQQHMDPKHGMALALGLLPDGPMLGPDGAIPGPDGPRSAGPGAGTAGVPGEPRLVVAGYEDGVVCVWDLRSPARPLAEKRGHGEPVMCLDVYDTSRGSPAACGTARSGERTAHVDVVSGSAGEDICFWRLSPTAPAAPTGAASTPTPNPPGSAGGGFAPTAAFCGPGKGGGGGVALEVAKQLRLREPGCADVRVRADGKLLAAACWDGATRLYSLRGRQLLAVLKYHRAQVTCVAFSPVRQALATASRDSTVALWDVYTSASAAGGGGGAA
ncbi:hypothetical protein HYH03_015634 [Edaphochlamys debaryana]|uniref:Uncharacterized protein n=1 Tax=Edaphochlamys debaryana TaxID=47281 RepID=A0A835XLT8_9CHLO|nr:hypothetical protein HYH03_015634 [Edaphochlamys debaryana]|eukprot:KAG2485662.1 hypothetical protein HYH03_015634 [Edaphochlamys debaryana]